MALSRPMRPDGTGNKADIVRYASFFSIHPKPKFSERAIGSLINRISDTPLVVQRLILALESGGMTDTECVPLKRTRDGRYQFEGKKYDAKELFVQIFRWPHARKKELLPIKKCQYGVIPYNVSGKVFPGGMMKMICLNPYHYEHCIPAPVIACPRPLNSAPSVEIIEDVRPEIKPEWEQKKENEPLIQRVAIPHTPSPLQIPHTPSPLLIPHTPSPLLPSLPSILVPGFSSPLASMLPLLISSYIARQNAQSSIGSMVAQHSFRPYSPLNSGRIQTLATPVDINNNNLINFNNFVNVNSDLLALFRQ